jgi:enoyl-CoA hydratase/carnithine racemase
MTEHIKIEKSDGILSLTMARPDKKNALTNAMYGALADAIEAAEADASVRVLLIRGEGDMFTAGNDVGEFAAIATGAVQGERHVGRFLQALAKSSRPLVAAVQGRAVGIGTTMLLHCDLVVLAENALLSTPFVNLALVPEAGSSLLMPLRIGLRAPTRCSRLVMPSMPNPRSPGALPTGSFRSTNSMRKQERSRPGWRNSRRVRSARRNG